MRFSGKRWEVLSDFLKPSQDLVRRFGHVIAQLLTNRGATEDPDRFLDLKLKNVVSSDEIPNLREGAYRIAEAVKKGKRIVLFGDYDADGITGTAILFMTLKSAGARVYPVLPKRNNGYGLSKDLIRQFSRYGDLLVTVDNGTSAVEEIDSSSIETVVIDHHNAPQSLPSRAVVVNPKILERDSEAKALSSAGMSFYVSVLLKEFLGLDLDPRVFLDLVALGTVADVMPMNLTNRILVSKGINLLQVTSRPGLKELLRVCNLSSEIATEDIAFFIAPRINAPGRIGSPDLAFKLLTARSYEEAKRLAFRIEDLNDYRKKLTNAILERALKLAQALKDKNFITLWDKRWHPGVIGIVAGRLSSLLERPVAIFSQGKLTSVGSVRSVEGLDVYEGLRSFSHMFIKWGGHSQAAGLTLETRLLGSFSDAMDEYFKGRTPAKQPLQIDMELPVDEINPALEKDLKKLSPFGEKNPYPTFLSEELNLSDFAFSKRLIKVKGKNFKVDWELADFIRKSRKVKLVYRFKEKYWEILDAERTDGFGENP